MEQKVRKHLLAEQEYNKLAKTLPDEKEFAEELHVYKEGESHKNSEEE